MKNKFKGQFSHKKATSIGLCVLLLICALAGCGQKSTNAPTDTAIEDTTATEEATAASETLPTETEEEALRTYYETLVEELRQELLAEREEKYISDYEYRVRIAELEAELSIAKEALKALTPSDTPTGAQPEPAPESTIPEEETQPEAPDTLFTYRKSGGNAIITGYSGRGTSVTIPSQIDGYTVIAIDDHAFKNTDVVSVIIPSSVTSVGWFAFYGCYALEIVTIPASVTSISYAAFDGCPSLTILCSAGSYAAEYAVSFGIRHQYV